MDIPTALGVLEDAAKRSQTENVQTEEVLAALKFLEGHEVRWPFEQFRKVLGAQRGRARSG